ncbi:MAG: twin-arginine translocation signal domain-containing protein [Gemmatimonadetes bacterium]|nr:twin-arginine translocation signal domain-containing protein [Gemmatimonadota bacterium]
MDRRAFVKGAAAAGAGMTLGASSLGGRSLTGVGGRPHGVVEPPDPRALIFDAMGELRPEYDAALMREMLASGLDAITVTLCDPKPVGAEALELAVDGLNLYDRFIASHPDLLLTATSEADIRRAQEAGRLAVFYLIQNTEQFGADPDRVDMFWRLGVRSAQITYNERNRAGVGCRQEGDDGGLTEFGRTLIERMNRVGMLVDLSHANMPTMADAIAASKAPVIVSHTGCDALYPHVRNATDANLRALAGKGGVVGICQLRPFLTDKKKDNLHTFFDHLDHAVKVCGVEQVAVGSDRDHRVVVMTPEYEAELRREEGSQVQASELPYFIDELNGPRRMEVVWDGLVARGYSEDDVERIMGGNLLRLYREVIG